MFISFAWNHRIQRVFWDLIWRPWELVQAVCGSLTEGNPLKTEAMVSGFLASSKLQEWKMTIQLLGKEEAAWSTLPSSRQKHIQEAMSAVSQIAGWPAQDDFGYSNHHSILKKGTWQVPNLPNSSQKYLTQNQIALMVAVPLFLSQWEKFWLVTQNIHTVQQDTMSIV